MTTGQLLLQSFYEDQDRAMRLGGLHHRSLSGVAHQCQLCCNQEFYWFCLGEDWSSFMSWLVYSGSADHAGDDTCAAVLLQQEEPRSLLRAHVSLKMSAYVENSSWLDLLPMVFGKIRKPLSGEIAQGLFNALQVT